MSKRDSDYYLRRIKIEKPEIYSDFVAGKFKSRREAIHAAGLKKDPSKLRRVMSILESASRDDQLKIVAEVIKYYKTELAPTVSSKPKFASPVNADKTLTSEARRDLDVIYARRGIKHGDMMREMGLNPLDVSVSSARTGSKLHKQEVIDALEKWIAANRRP